MSTSHCSSTANSAETSNPAAVLHVGSGLLGLSPMCGARDTEGNPVKIAPAADQATCTWCRLMPGSRTRDARHSTFEQHETRIMPTEADVLAIAEHHGAAFVEVDGWVNTLVHYPGGSTVVYKAATGSAVC